MPGHSTPHGYGWHELPTNRYAGSHASTAALKLLVHPRFPLPTCTRKNWIEEAVLGVVVPFIKLPPGHTPEYEERLLEAQQCTVKVANFLSACAALANSTVYHQFYATNLRPLALPVVRRFAKALGAPGIGHWIGHRQRDIPRPFATAASYDALFRLGCVDGDVKKLTAASVLSFADEIMETFRELLDNFQGQPPAPELWRLLPALRTIAIMPDGWLRRTHGRLPPTRESFERIFNAYLRHELFAFGLNHTDDFQKYRADGTPSGTDYVAFNTTACLARAMIAAIETDKIHPSYGEWIAPHLCLWAEQLKDDKRLPQPARFSYIHQTLSCVLAAMHLQTNRRCIPKTVHMNIFPRVFPNHAFARKTRQGFYVTPFEFEPEWGMKKSSEALFTDFKAACHDFQVGEKQVDLVRGDHTNMGVITENIWRHINESQFIIALCVGANPNVYYEVGVADTLGKPVLLVGRKIGTAPMARGKKPVAARLAGSDFKFDISHVHHAELDVTEFDLHNLKPIVESFLTKVYGRQTP